MLKADAFWSDRLWYWIVAKAMGSSPWDVGPRRQAGLAGGDRRPIILPDQGPRSRVLIPGSARPAHSAAARSPSAARSVRASRARRSSRFKTAWVIGRLASGNVRARQQVARFGPVERRGERAGRLGGRAGEEVAGVVHQRRATPDRPDRPEPEVLVQPRDGHLERAERVRAHAEEGERGPARDRSTTCRRVKWSAWPGDRPRGGARSGQVGGIFAQRPLRDRRRLAWARGVTPGEVGRLEPGVDPLGLDVDQFPQAVAPAAAGPGDQFHHGGGVVLDPLPPGDRPGPSAKLGAPVGVEIGHDRPVRTPQVVSGTRCQVGIDRHLGHLGGRARPRAGATRRRPPRRTSGRRRSCGRRPRSRAGPAPRPHGGGRGRPRPCRGGRSSAARRPVRGST